ncbi:protein kinase [Sorangium sp. So ce321]|uniref:protein kinase domain-containing protein n=1 Tax=Sorangium sp. So ce321 TaxID=3133300 RepID=UPI003F5F8B2F
MTGHPDAAAPVRTQTDTAAAGDACRLTGMAGGEAWPRGHVLLDDFVVERLLGRGGMGEVYLVESLLTRERYAVKRARVSGTAQRRRFLGELRSWIDLPSHPNLMQLRFARTISEEMLLFTDHADGGSLADWIRQHRLDGLPAALRLAVQLAHGVEAAHRANIVHQDVKPGNFLLTGVGEVKLSDFGLARARTIISAEDGTGLARHAGLTLAYCSPEQYARRSLGPQTDVWSLGLSILEVFTGGATWNRGVEAPDVLDALLRNGGQRTGLAPMPDGLAGILRRCFAPRPEDRWSSGAEVRVALSRLHEDLLGESPALPAVSTGASRDIPRPSKPLQPQVHLARAMELAGRGAPDVGPPARETSLSQRAQLIEALSLYEEARTLLEGLPGQDEPAVQRAAAELFEEKGWAHAIVDDLPGASAATAHAIARWEALLQRRRDPEIAGNLLGACSLQGLILSKLHRSDLAHQHFERVRDTIVPLIRAEGWDHLGVHVPSLLMTEFSALSIARDLRGALSVCDRALQAVSNFSEFTRERLAAAPPAGREALEQVCATLDHQGEVWQMNKACVLDDLGRHAEADAILAVVVDARERRLAVGGDTPAAVQELALASYNRAMVLRRLHDNEGALRLLEHAAGLCDRLVDGTWPEEVKWDVTLGLVEARQGRSAIAGTRGCILADLGRFDEALALSAQSVAWCEELVVDEGRMELGLNLSRSYQNYAEILASAGRRDESRAAFGKSEAMLRHLYAHNPSRVHEELALLYGKRARRLADRAGAERDPDLEQAIWLYEVQLKDGGRAELLPDLAGLYLKKARNAAEKGDAFAAESAVDRVLELVEGHEPRTLSRCAVVDWTEALQRKANLHARRGELDDALPYYERAIGLLRPLCKGHRERWENLAFIYLNLGNALGKLQRVPETARSYRRAASLLGPVCRDGGVHLVPFFVQACLYSAFACFAMERTQAGRVLAERGVAAADEAVAQGKMAVPEHLQRDLALARRKLREMRLEDRYAGGIDPGDLLARMMPGGSMNRAVQEFFFCYRWEDKRRAVLRHEDELLDPMSLAMFDFMTEGLSDAEPEGQAMMREAVSIHLASPRADAAVIRAAVEPPG